MKLAVRSGRYKIRHGHDNPNYRGGRFRHSSGYVFLNTPCGPILEHRFLMELFLGRQLTEREQVHHKNGIRDDNRLENLELMDRAQHTRDHWNRLTPKQQMAKLQAARAAWWGKGKRK